MGCRRLRHPVTGVTNAARDRPIERVAHIVEKHSRLGIHNAHRGFRCEAHTALCEREKVVKFDESANGPGVFAAARWRGYALAASSR
jgi:hypothetical protein